MKKIFIFLLLFISSCGYQPLYVNDIKNIEFSKITFLGEENIGKKIINSLSIKENTLNKNLDKLDVNITYNIEETSKNSLGQITTLRSTINVNFTTRNENKSVETRNFSKNFNYQNKENKFELINYQNNIKNNLIAELIQDIRLYLNTK